MPVILILIGLVLFAGPVVQFLPSITWQGGPVANAMVWHDRQRIEQIILLIVFSIGVTTVWRRNLDNTLARLPRLTLIPLLLVFMFGGISASISEFPRYAWLEWSTLILLMGLMFLLADEASRTVQRFDIYAIVLVLAVTTTIVARVMMGYLAACLEGMRLDSVKLFTSVVSNRRVFGQVASMAIPLLAYPLLVPGKIKFPRVWFYILLAAWWMLAIVSGSRGTWMALGVATLILAVFAWPACSAWIKTQSIGLATGLFLYGVVFTLLPALAGLEANVEYRLNNLTDLSGRSELWAVAMSTVTAHPFLGAGPMSLAAVPGLIGAHPHNALLQISAEWGVPAMLALLVPVTYSIVILLRRLSRPCEDQALLICLSASILAASTQAMVDGVIVMPYTQTWLVLVVGWAIGIFMRGGRDIKDGHQYPWWRRRLLLPVSVGFALIMLLKGIYPDVFYRVEATKAYLDAGHTGIPPRYWQVGPIP